MKSILDFAAKKRSQEKISMVTCYDFAFATILQKTDIDVILVGDSVAQVIHGYPNTLSATVSMMATHTAAVARGLLNKFIVTDLPFLSTRKGLEVAMNAVHQLMTSGAHAVKIEGAQGHLDLIKHVVGSGVPVMGHLGLTPQSVHQLGGHHVQARHEKEAQALRQDAIALEEAGCFALVLECIPALLAQKVTEQLQIPTIGIGAGSQVDGQVLVLHDMLGLNPEFKPKFLKHYSHQHEATTLAINTFVQEAKNASFPGKEHTYE